MPTPDSFLDALPAGHRLEPEYAPHLARYRAQATPAHATLLLSALKPVIDTGVKLHGGKAPSPMTRSRAKQIALGAAATYDPARGPLKGHVLNALQGLKRYAAKEQQVLAVPEAVAQDQYHLARATAELRDELLRDPSDEELADRTGLSTRRLAHVRGYRPGFAQGQVEATGDAEGGPSEAAVARADPTLRAVQFLYPDLDPIDKVIVEDYYGLNGKPRRTFTRTAKALNLSGGAVSQRALRIQSMIDELNEAGLF